MPRFTLEKLEQLLNYLPMAKKATQMITIKEFAEAVKRPYSTVALWLNKGLIPGAQATEIGGAKFWQIPIDAIETFEPPKQGRPRKESSKKASKKK